jgi:hypothetical protein
MTARDVVWSVLAIGIAGTTAWGHVEFLRRRKQSDVGELSAFSTTIDECASRPLVSLEVSEPHDDPKVLPAT